MKNKLWIWIVTAVYALPLPISLVSILGTIISIANIGASNNDSVSLTVIAVISMILAGTYLVTYTVTTIFTFFKKKLNFINLLPLFHILLTVASCVVWSKL